MKETSFIAVCLVVMTTFLSCSKPKEAVVDNPQPQPSQDWIIGKWNGINGINSSGTKRNISSFGWYISFDALKRFEASIGSTVYQGSYVYREKGADRTQDEIIGTAPSLGGTVIFTVIDHDDKNATFELNINGTVFEVGGYNKFEVEKQ